MLGKKRYRLTGIIIAMCAASTLGGCGQQAEDTPMETVDFAQVMPEQSEPVILREPVPETETDTEEESESTTQEEERIPFADRSTINYVIENEVYENTVNGTCHVKIEYPKMTHMDDEELSNRINENIKQAALQGSGKEGQTVYELSYEIATKGTGIVSVVFRGYVNYEGTAHPSNIIKTLNLDLTTGENLRVKDYADLAGLVTGLETTSGYAVISEGVEQADFSAFLNNGYVTDYALTMLDYDVDFNNLSLVPTGYSCIRNNHVVLFIEAEHAMGDYVEIEFDTEL